MKSALLALEEGITDLRRMIAGLQCEERILAMRLEDSATDEVSVALRELKEAYGASSARKKELTYNGTIITAYGLLERFVEDLVSGYLSRITRAASAYAKLPPKLRESHARLSVELLSRLHHQRYQGVLRFEDVISNLASCVVNPAEAHYRLNIHALTYHPANLRHAMVVQLFEQLGIEALEQRLKQNDGFSEYLRGIHPRLPESGPVSDDVAFGPLNDLAQRRNDVAHGVRGEILSLDLVRTRIEHVRAYCQGLYEIVYDAMCGALVDLCGIPLGRPVAIYNHRIVCVKSAARICVGDILIAKSGDTSRPFRGGRILEIQVDHMPVARLEGTQEQNAGLRVEFSARDNHEFFVVPE